MDKTSFVWWNIFHTLICQKSCSVFFHYFRQRGIEGASWICYSCSACFHFSTAMGGCTTLVSDWASTKVLLWLVSTTDVASCFWTNVTISFVCSDTLFGWEATALMLLDAASFVSWDMLVLMGEGFFVLLNKLIFWDGSFGRDLRVGFLTFSGGCPLAGFWDTFLSKLNLLVCREVWSASLVGELFLRPSLGDLALVVGIYIIK